MKKLVQPSDSPAFKFHDAPGFLIRRAHQHSLSVFAQQTEPFGVTAIQFAILNVLIEFPESDQISVANSVAFDAATIGSVIGRLESKKLIVRSLDQFDKRRKLLKITPLGLQLVKKMKPYVEAVQVQLLQNLSQQEQRQLKALLQRLVA
jgi:DNA-binding MarR family transcriptional regulator